MNNRGNIISWYIIYLITSLIRRTIKITHSPTFITYKIIIYFGTATTILYHSVSHAFYFTIYYYNRYLLAFVYLSTFFTLFDMLWISANIFFDWIRLDLFWLLVAVMWVVSLNVWTGLCGRVDLLFFFVLCLLVGILLFPINVILADTFLHWFKYEDNKKVPHSHQM